METKKGKKVTVLGAGNVGASIAYTLTVCGTCSEIVLVDINKPKAKGEALDISQGVSLCPTVKITDGEYEDAAGSDVVVVTLGIARKPGQSRLDLAQTNVNIIKDVMPKVTKFAPNAIYVIVSNPVDILTYTILKCTDLKPEQVIGSGTLLDSSRLRADLAARTGVSVKNIHGYVLGEHGDSSMVPWSMVTIAGMSMKDYCEAENVVKYDTASLDQVLEDVRTAGAEVIKCKGATFYAIALSVNKICDSILRDSGDVLPVSTLTNGRYGTEDVCLSLPYQVGITGIKAALKPKFTAEEEERLVASSKALKAVIDQLAI